MKAYLVVPTISIPRIAEEYCKNFARFGHKNEVGIFIIGDNKSQDHESHALTQKLVKQGFQVEYIDIKREKQWSKKYKNLSKIIRANSDSRRIVGFLMALERKCDFLISVDDDNFPIADEDFFAHHSIVGTAKTLPVVATNTGWFNVCTDLTMSVPQPIYPRGFPYRERHRDIQPSFQNKKIYVGANIGLWINEPDVDSITRLSLAPKATKFSGKQLALDQSCHTPINTQNTAITSDLIPAFYYILMGEWVDGMILDRDGDIWTGWFLRKVMNTLGSYLSVGHPITDHRRNAHDHFLDLRHELGCLTYTEPVLDTIESISPKGRNAIEVYDDLTNQFYRKVVKNKKLSPDFKAYARKLHFCQKVWLDTVQKIIDSRIT